MTNEVTKTAVSLGAALFVGFIGGVLCGQISQHNAIELGLNKKCAAHLQSVNHLIMNSLLIDPDRSIDSVVTRFGFNAKDLVFKNFDVKIPCRVNGDKARTAIKYVG